ncbi:Hypothetical predicted protein [Cloeon dipterum]|uniref:C2H2-type domain-containing protein n=1 Tax=Cloeon dipterum TaxID=197152 RepID=A0A8S1C9S1_9INSE|nr:Hypothetical predicted protein [Cloeon dipterum]
MRYKRLELRQKETLKSSKNSSSEHTDGPYSYVNHSEKNVKRSCLESTNGLFKLFAHTPAPHKVEEYRKCILNVKAKCSTLITQLENHWRYHECAEDLAILEKLYYTRSTIDIKYNAMAENAGSYLVGNQLLDQQRHQAFNGAHASSATFQEFEKPIGRGQRLREPEQPLRSVGGLSSQGNNSINPVPVQQPLWVPSISNPLLQPAPTISNFPGYFMPLVFNPYGVPVGIMPMQQPLQLMVPPRSKAQPSTVKVETVELSDSDDDKESSIPREPLAETIQQEFMMSPPETEQPGPSSPPKSPQIYSVPVEMEDNIHENLICADESAPEEPPLPRKMSAIENQEFSHISRPVASSAKSTSKKQPPSNIYSFLQHANVPLGSSKHWSPPHPKQNMQPSALTSQNISSIGLPPPRKPPNTVKRSQPVKLGVPKKQLSFKSSTETVSSSCEKSHALNPMHCGIPKITTAVPKNYAIAAPVNELGLNAQPPQSLKESPKSSRLPPQLVQLRQTEVLISRLSPTALQQALSEVDDVPPMEGTFRCRLCPKQLEGLSTLKDHISTHTGEFNYCCSECNFTFPEKNNFEAHWMKHHSAKHGPIPNAIELNMFPQPKTSNHIPGYVCPVCNWLQLKKERVEKHVENVHGIDTLRCNRIQEINMVPSKPVEVKPKRKRKVADSKDHNGEKYFKKTIPSDDFVPCLICKEPYILTTKKSDWIKKLQALKEGYQTDCTFLVGANSAESKRFSGLKRDFLLASSSFDSILNFKDEVTIRNIPPHIFECILEFVHIGKCSKKITLVTDAIALIKGARFLKIEAVVLYSNHLIMKLVRVDTVWEILNSACKLPLDKCITDVCCKLISAQLLDCINHHTFLNASQESVVTLLKIDAFFANADEYCLLNACLKWISNQPYYMRRSTFKNLLPHLRILSLDGEVCAMISDYITETEQASLFTYYGNPDQDCERLPNFVCKISNSRFLRPAQQSSITIVSENLTKTRDFVHLPPMRDAKIVNSFRFVATADLYLTGIELLGRLFTEARLPSASTIFKPLYGKADRLKLKRLGNTEDEYEENICLVISNSAAKDLIHFFIPKDSFTSIEIELINPQGSFLKIDPSAVLNQLMSTETVVKTFDLSLKNLNDDFEYEDPLLYFIQSLKFILA